MTRQEGAVALDRALALSHDLLAVADGGDLSLVVSLDAERLKLLKSARVALHPLDEAHRLVFCEITALNDKTLGFLEHRQRAKGRDMDMAAVGRRAVSAYANNSANR